MKQNDVFVIGDSINDLEMITQYHGFCVENAEPNIKAVAVKIYPHVYNLIEINGGKIMKNIAVVYNPESGHHDCHKFIRYVSSIMNKYDYNDMYCPTQGKNDSTEIIRNLPNDIDLVLIAGGDGTLNESINGNCLRKKTSFSVHSLWDN